ncbi:hypothetical protein BK768_07350 [Bacillus thuringiensis serovar tohokuensis]|nr:hypothetical protein BK768_07350 [Bacillus thuringiensis serovar tohokuensis]OUB98437.1 hypothetical protein BK773_01975 [Bacillus thuringiensis serovar indiana]
MNSIEMSDDMLAVRIEEIYQEILDGDRKKFPPGTWSEDENNELARRVTKYLIEQVLIWNIQDLREGWNQKLIQKMKLTTVLAKYNNSPYRMLNDAYPGHVKEWELKMAPLHFWTKENGLNALKWTIEEKEQLDEKEILKVYSTKWLAKHKLTTPCRIFFKDSPYMMINSLYPGRFKEWQFQCVPKYFWTKKIAIEALLWTIEKKEQLNAGELLQKYSLRWIKEQNLYSPCFIFWKGSPYAFLNELYPNRFKEWELLVTPKGFWTKEKALEALKWTIEEKEKLSDKELKSKYSMKWLIQHGLRTPVNQFFKDSPYQFLNDLYPNRFKEWELPVTPNGFWTEEKALEALKWTIEEKEQLSDEELKRIYSARWIKNQKLSVPLHKFWSNNPFIMLNSLYPGRFKRWEFSVSPYNFWTEKNALEALRWTIEEKVKLTEETLLQIYTGKWIKQQGLKYPCDKFWGSSPYDMLHALYPNRFSKHMLKGYKHQKKNRLLV